MKSSAKNILYLVVFTIVTLILITVANGIKSYVSKANDGCAVAEEKPTVILDAGHGGEDGGAVGANGVYEKELNLAFAFEIGEMLKSEGVDVIYTRTEDLLLYDKNADYKNRKKMLDLAARVKIAQSTANGIFVSIHMNSFSQDKYKGLQVYYSKNHPLSYTLAHDIQTAVKNELQPENNRKATEASSRIYVLDRLDRPAILIECGFVSNREECDLLCTNAYRKQLSEIICRKIKKCVEKNCKTY